MQTGSGQVGSKKGNSGLGRETGFAPEVNKNVHVPKMQHNTPKIFLRNILSLCLFAELSFILTL